MNKGDKRDKKDKDKDKARTLVRTNEGPGSDENRSPNRHTRSYRGVGKDAGGGGCLAHVAEDVEYSPQGLSRGTLRERADAFEPGAPDFRRAASATEASLDVQASQHEAVTAFRLGRKSGEWLRRLSSSRSREESVSPPRPPLPIPQVDLKSQPFYADLRNVEVVAEEVKPKLK